MPRKKPSASAQAPVNHDTNHQTGQEAGGAWQLSLGCTRAQAEAIDEESGEHFADWTSTPALLTSEIDESEPDKWRLDVILDHEPDKHEISAVLALVPGSTRKQLSIEALPATDWVTQSQIGLDPITAGRFHIVHDLDTAPLGDHVNFRIPASRAFGTGQHETTKGCLLTLDALARSGHRFGNVADIGTGTGLLAFAALSLWPNAHAIASDIDPVAIEVTAENAILNGVALGGQRGALALVAAPGVDDAMITGLAPYDLIIANILAGPLIALAPGISAQLAEGGSLILAGLLDKQAEAVISAYRKQGLRLAARHDDGHWPTLHLRKRRRYGWRRNTHWRQDVHGEAPGFGSW